MVTASMISLTLAASAMRATPPSALMSAGTRSRAITAAAPASSAILACSAVVTSMITPPLSISASPDFTVKVPVSRCIPPSFGRGARGSGCPECTAVTCGVPAELPRERHVAVVLGQELDERRPGLERDLVAGPRLELGDVVERLPAPAPDDQTTVPEDPR